MIISDFQVYNTYDFSIQTSFSTFAEHFKNVH